MRLLYLIGFVVNWCSVLASSTELPCNFFDSVNITSGNELSNKSIMFDGIEYPEGQYAKLNYVLNDGTAPTSVHSHIRGCLCNRKPCIRLCCPFGKFYSNENGREECHSSERATNIEGEILDHNNQTKYVKLNEKLSIVDRVPCSGVFSVRGDYQIQHVRHFVSFSEQFIE